MSGAIKFGDEFLVNTTTPSFQYMPAIAGLTNGRFVAAWVDDSRSPDDPSESAIRAQVFNADGSKAGEEFLVNTTVLNEQIQPSIAALSDGRFVVTWTDGSQTGEDTSFLAVRAQIFNVDGSPSGSEFVVPATTRFDQLDPAVAALRDGRFVAAWEDDSVSGGDADGGAIRAQIFNADDSPSNDEILANTTVAGSQYQPSVALLANGNFVVAWSDWSGAEGDTSAPGIRAQIFGSNGSTVGGELVVNSTIAGAQHHPSVTALANGGFVISWTDDSGWGDVTSTPAVRARIFGSDGMAVGADFVVANTTTGNITSSVTALPDGSFVAAWVNDTASGEGTILHAQIFTANGSPSGEVLTVNAADYFFRQFAVTPTADGRFVVTWEGYSTSGDDDSDSSIHARIFDSRSSGVNLAGTADGDDFIGTGFTDLLAWSAGNDRLDGSDGNDVLYAGDGDDLLIGGAGDDRAVFAGSRADYQVSRLANGDIHLIDQRAGSPDGTETARGIELFTFADGNFSAEQLLGANHAPVVANAIADLSSPEDAPLIFQVPANTFSDQDGNPLTYTATLADGSTLPAWLAFDAATRTFTGTPPHDWNGAIDVKVIASDGGFSAAEIFRFTVTPVDDAPGFTSGSLKVSEFAANGTAMDAVRAEAAGDNAFSYVLLDDAGGRFAIDSNGSLMVVDGLRLDFEQAAAHTIVVRATDQAGVSVDQALTIAVDDVNPETITGDSRANVFVGGAGGDRFFGAAGKDHLTGGAGKDKLRGGAAADDLAGGVGNDRLGGGGGRDHLTGGAGKDKLQGGTKADILAGGNGDDRLAGGAGKDMFLFASKLNDTANVDRIIDFNGEVDTIALDRSFFKALDTGRLDADAFYSGAGASAGHDGNDRIIYDTRSGALSYDRDGEGGAAAVQFAVLHDSPDNVGFGDFVVVA